MPRGGKRPGAGRKPKPAKDRKIARKIAMLVRVEPQDRRQLERVAKRNRWSLSSEVERRLRASLRKASGDHPRGWPEDRQTKALCYLIEQMAGRTRQLPTPQHHWRNNRFVFEAFKSSIALLLDKLAPPGKVSDFKHAMFETPEALATAVVFSLWNELLTATVPTDEMADILGLEPGSPFYAIPRAARDLGINA
jgi:hypothetical protein